MTKPDSTDAGGVTHEEARDAVIGMARESGWMAVGRKLTRYIDAQEAALATLTRERDSLQEAQTHLVSAALDVLSHHIDARPGSTLFKALRALDVTIAPFTLGKPATPPAPLPGGQGPVEALRRELIDLLRKAASDEELSWDESLHRIADRLEQGGEGREG